MDKNRLKLIEENLIESLHWNTLNTPSMEMPRVEGVCLPDKFKSDMLAHLQPYATVLEKLSNNFVCGFEIEFYLHPEKIPLLQEQIAEVLPDYQMLLISLEQVIKTNHRNFYLIKENTGQAPEGMRSYELISPILDYKSLPYFIHEFFTLLTKLEAADNDSIGFHLHVSTQNAEKISPLSLLYFLDQQQVLSSKERQYTRDIIQQFFDYTPDSWQWIFEEVTRKCYNVNLLHYDENNHIELRAMGGQGYLQDSTAIIHNALQCLLAYEKALSTPIQEVAKGILNSYPLQQCVTHTKSLHHKQLSKENRQEVWFV